MLQLTERAVDKVKALLKAENKAGYGLRVAVQGGGCAGFQYGLTWENEQRSNDNVLEFDGRILENHRRCSTAGPPLIERIDVDILHDQGCAGAPLGDIAAHRDTEPLP